LVREPPAGPETTPAGSSRRRVLLDESVPHEIAAAVTEPAVATVQGLGWAGMRNGALLRAARTVGFEVLVTVDRHMQHQQNVAVSGLALVVLRARSTRVPELIPVVPALNAVLSEVRVGTVTELRAA
jgi:hypothetical protein